MARAGTDRAEKAVRRTINMQGTSVAIDIKFGTQGYDQDYQPFFNFAALLQRLLTAEVPTEDPRKYLRYAAACVIGRHFEDRWCTT